MPFDAKLARESLMKINPGPDGLESLKQCQTNVVYRDVRSWERRYDDFKAAAPQSDSALLNLPKKILTQIYTYAVSYKDSIPIRINTFTNKVKGEMVIARQSSFFTPPLFLTCRQTRKDAAPLFYARNSFKAELTDGGTDTLVTWLTYTDRDYLALVPKLIISIAPISFFDVQTLKDAARTKQSESDTRTLARLITSKGITGSHVSFESPEMKHLAKDTKLLMPGVGNSFITAFENEAHGLRAAWFQELRKCLDHGEYSTALLVDEFGYLTLEL